MRLYFATLIYIILVWAQYVIFFHSVHLCAFDFANRLFLREIYWGIREKYLKKSNLKTAKRRSFQRPKIGFFCFLKIFQPIFISMGSNHRECKYQEMVYFRFCLSEKLRKLKRKNKKNMQFLKWIYRQTKDIWRIIFLWWTEV